MALVKCPECGKEISNRATSCPNCGYPISQEINPNTENLVSPTKPKPLKPSPKKKKLKLWQKILIGVGGFVVVLAILFVIFILIPSVKTVKSFEGISPYLDYVGNPHPDEYDPITLSEEEYNNIDNVEFMGMRGEISFKISDGCISSCTWTSLDNYPEKEYIDLAEDLSIYFEATPKSEQESNSKGNAYRYYWTDPYYGFYVTMAHGLNTYDPTGQIDIRWSYTNSQLQIVKEPENSTEEYDTEEERDEVRDHDEFKTVITDCLSLVPDCEIYFGSEDTGSDDSYAIKVDDTIIGILGINMDSYDAVALIDDGKDFDGLYLEQISIAMIMSCDSDIDYDEAYNIYQESNNDDSVRIKSGVYGFKGIVDGMDAFAIDISWL